MARPLDIKRLKTYSIYKRKSLVFHASFGTLMRPSHAATVINSFPGLLAGRNLRTLILEVAQAHRRHKPVACAIGGHVIKVGCGPILIDLIKRGIVTSVAMNGAAAIHDYELSLTGQTSEDVAKGLQDGSFGMARETAEAFDTAANVGSVGITGYGLGRAIGEIAHSNAYRNISVLAACYSQKIPITVHLSIGADIVHMHPEASGADLGQSTLTDFRILCDVVAGLEKGIWMNIGSAVMMPEVFLKAVSVARNLGAKLKEFTAVNLDMIQHYRPLTNVLARPKGNAISLTGHHEIMLPLIRGGVVAALEGYKIWP